jgi:hypothetical protein
VFSVHSDDDTITPVMFVLTGLDAEEIRRRFSSVFPQAVGRIPPVSDPR